MTKTTFLNFEQPVAELESKIEELRFVQDDSAVDISEEIDRLAKKSQHLRQADSVASVPDRAPPAASVHDGLRERDLHRFP